MLTLQSFDTTIKVRDSCFCLDAQHAARTLAIRRSAATLRSTNGSFSLPMALNRPIATPVAPVAHLLAMDRTTLTAALKPLDRRGFVEERVDPADQRSRLLMLTTAGRTVLASLIPSWRATHLDVEAALVDPDMLWRELIALA